jgi:hypothetical protein
MKTKIHVNQYNIKANAKDGGTRPTITVKDYKQNRKGRSASWDGPSTLVDSALAGVSPLSCGAKVWIETHSPVEVVS